MSQVKISIVVPDGSMQNTITDFFARAGLPISMEKQRTKEGRVGADWIKCVVFQRPQEIPIQLYNGHFDVAIGSEDWIANWGYYFPVLFRMPIGRSGNKPVKIVLAVSQKSSFQRLEELPEGCEVATEYVQLVQRFFIENGRSDIRVMPSWGNTEQKIRFGATAIVDVTETGNSLKENELRVICEIMTPNIVIVANSSSYEDEFKKPYIDCFVRLIKGAYQASNYILLTANVEKRTLKKAGQIMGGLKSPTCSPLLTKGWFALQSFVPRENEQDIIFKLLAIGVIDIAVTRDIPLIML